MQRKDDREREKNPSATLPVEKPQLQFASRDDIPSHDAAGRPLDPATGKLATGCQPARASELRQQKRLDTGLRAPGAETKKAIPVNSVAERLRAEREDSKSDSEFDPDCEY